jgi:hypothetical protein
VDSATHQLIKDACKARGLSLQEFVTYAAEVYAKMPADWTGAVSVFNPDRKFTKHEEELIGLWARYVMQMPQHRVLLLEEFMRVDMRNERKVRERKKGEEPGGKTKRGR